ncbi:MAG: DUF4349 domain-containing protein [Brotaphodocola sp.]
MKKIIFTTLLTSLLLTGCSISGNTSAAEPAAYAVAEPAAYAVAETAAAMQPQEALNWAEEEQGSAAETSLDTVSDSGLFSSTTPKSIQTSRKLIRTIDMSVETTDFDNLLSSVSSAVSSLGGYVEQSNISGNSIYSSRDARRNAFLTARIPADKIDQLLEEISEFGNVTNRSENVRDVTLQYSDIESHKKSLTIEQERLWELLEQTESVDAIIALESRLSEIRYQLESYESQLRTYDNQVEYSTVNLYVEEVKVFTPTSPDSIGTRIQKGFQKNIETIGDDCINLFVWLASSIPLFFLWGIIIGAAIVVGRKGFRIIIHRRNKKGKKSSESSNEDMGQS